MNPDSSLRYLVWLVLLLPVFIFRDYTPDNELKYISIVDEALRNGTWFTFYNHGEIYADKPPLFFWFIMLAKGLTGGYPMGFIGLFSLLPAIGILAVMDRWFRHSGIAHHPVVSNLLLLTTVMYLGAALVVRMDMLMTFFIVLSLYTFFRVYEGKAGRAGPWLLPVYIFLAIFSKGAMGFLIPLVSIVVFLLVKKEMRSFGRFMGWKQWAVLVGLCAVWFGCVYLEGGREYLHNILFKQTVGRGINSFHHKEPVWFYFPRMLWSFAPWILLYIVLIWRGIRRKMLTTDTQKFFAVIVVANTVMLSLISSKIDIYLLPIYPFAVYLCASLLPVNKGSLGVKIAIGIPAVVFALGLTVAFIARKYVSYDFTGILPYLAAGLLSAGGIAGLGLLFRNRSMGAIVSLGTGLLLMLFVCGFAVPQFNRYIGFRELAQSAGDRGRQEGIEEYAYYKFDSAPNMDVYLGKPLAYVGTVEQLDSLDNLPRKTILFVRAREARREKAFSQWTEARQSEWTAGEFGWYILGED